MSKPTSREIAVNTTGLKPVGLRTPSLSRMPAAGAGGAGATPDDPASASGDAAKTAAANWPRTLLRPPEQAARSKLRFRVPGIFTLLLVGGLIWFGYFPRIGALESSVPERTAIMDARAKEADAAVRRGGADPQGSCAGVRADLQSCQRYDPVALSDIAPVMVQAVVIGMDPHFDERQGNDWSAMRRAAGYPRPAFEWSNGTDRADLFAVVPRLLNQMEAVGRRGSLTQLLVQHLYFPANKGLFRKMREIRVSRRVARALPKERIVALYLNVAEFGPGLYGVEAAAKAYFSVSAAIQFTGPTL
jgi:monofunctional biosynthetic peptidoglycan transglycosylase